VALFATLEAASTTAASTTCNATSHSIGGAENAKLENAGLEFGEQNSRAGKCRTGKYNGSDKLRLKQPQTSSTIDVSKLSQNCVGLLHEVVDVHVHFCSKIPYYRTVLQQQFFSHRSVSRDLAINGLTTDE